MATVLGSTGVSELKSPVKAYSLRDKGMTKIPVVVYPCTTPPSAMQLLDTPRIHNIVLSSDSQVLARVSGVTSMITVKHLMNNNTTQPELAIMVDEQENKLEWTPIISVVPYKLKPEDQLFTIETEVAQQGVLLNTLIIR